METVLPFFLILVASIFFSTIFARLHFPWVIALIIGGIVMGPHGLGFLQFNETISFFAEIGLIFLMFMAGLEVKLSSFREFRAGVISLSLFSILIPLFVGITIGSFFGYDTTATTLLGIIFISSSVAVAIPTLENRNLLSTKLGRVIVATTIIGDVVSLVLLSLLFQTTSPTTNLPLPFFYLLAFAAMVFLRQFLPWLKWAVSVFRSEERDQFQQELRTVFVGLLGTVIVFELLGLHPIIAGFFAGLVLSESISTDAMMMKLRAISYGLFIPIFFVSVGANIDITVFLRGGHTSLLTLAIVVGSVFAKFGSGFLGGKFIGFSSGESYIIGASTIPQLSTTLAALYAGVDLGIISVELSTALVALSVVTTFVGPVLVNFFVSRSKRLTINA